MKLDSFDITMVTCNIGVIYSHLILQDYYQHKMVDEGVDEMYQHWKLVNHCIGGYSVGNLIWRCGFR